MCLVLFPSGHLQSNDTFLHWDLRLYPYRKLKQVWKLAVGPEVERQLRQLYTALDLHLLSTLSGAPMPS